MNRINFKRLLGLLIYAIGVILALVFIILAAWADFEAFSFDSALTADRSLTTLSCPLVISKNESATISATFRNPSQRSLRRLVRTRITEGMVSMTRQIDTTLEISPGEEKSLEWTATGEDAAYGLFILARVYMLRDYPFPSQAGTCGILVIDTGGLRGNQISILVVISSIIGMAVGWGLWNNRVIALDNRKNHTMKGMLALAVVLCVGIVSTLLGWWIIGAFLLLTSLLLILEIFFYTLVLSR